MDLRVALSAIHAAREVDDIVISAMGAAREWMALGTAPLDWIFVPSSMGQASSVGLGLALARPDRRIIVLNGDGGMLMNLGSLVTISACAPKNLIMLLLDNGVYEITGAQPTPSASAARAGGDPVNFAALARAGGIRTVFEFSTIEAWRAGLAQVLRSEGPVCAVLKIAPVPQAKAPCSPGPAPARAKAFMAALNPEPPTW